MRTSDEKIAPLLRQVNQLQDVIAALANILAAQPHVDPPLSVVKRKHETITNEALKKQYQPLEEMQIRVDARVDAVQDILAKAFEENIAIPPYEAMCNCRRRSMKASHLCLVVSKSLRLRMSKAGTLLSA